MKIYDRLLSFAVLATLFALPSPAQQAGATLVSSSAQPSLSAGAGANPVNPPPAPPAVPSDKLNSHLPSWLRFSGEIRLRGAGALGDFFKADTNDAYLLSRFRLNMAVMPTAWMSFHFQAQDSRVIGDTKTASLPALQQDTMDLRLAYVELGKEDHPVSARIGRQELAFGEERLIGPANWLNTPRSFDGASATFHVNGVRLDAFAASVVKIHDRQFNESTPGNDIYGLYSSFAKLVPDSKVEPYLFWRRQSGLTVEPGVLGISNFATIGVRWAGKAAGKTDYDVEVAKQAGSEGPKTIAAWAGHWLGGYTLTHTRFSPRFVAEYNYATGNNPANGKISTFNQLFPSGHDLYGLTDQVGWQNIEHVRTGVELKVRPDWTVSSKYSSYWLADDHDALYNTAGVAIAVSPSGKAGSYVGQELDFVLSHKYKVGPVVSGGVGHLFPGTFLQDTTPGKSYTFPYAAVAYAF